VHLVVSDADNSRPAKFVVFLVKKQGAPVRTPLQ
jgi:hypothetical protein